jgi:hypothetical protein
MSLLVRLATGLTSQQNNKTSVLSKVIHSSPKVGMIQTGITLNLAMLVRDGRVI